jgi:small-conductance mechanosensitive channel
MVVWLFLLLHFWWPSNSGIVEVHQDTSRSADVQSSSPNGDSSSQKNDKLRVSAEQQESPIVVVDSEKQQTREKRDEIAQQIRFAEREIDNAGGESDGPAESTAINLTSDEKQRVRLLKQLEVLLAQREQQNGTFNDTTKELHERAKELREVHNGRIGIEKPYSFLLLDQLQDELATLQSKLASSYLNQTLTNEDIVQAKQQLERKEQAYRLAKENKQVVAPDRVGDDSRYALDVKLATETLAYRKKRLEILKLRAEILTLQIQIVETKIQAIRPEAEFSQLDLKSKNAEVDKHDQQLRSRLEGLERAMEESDAKWLSDEQLRRSGAKQSALEVEEFELRRYERQFLQFTVSSISFRLELLNQTRQAWDQRFQVANRAAAHEQNIEFERRARENIAQRDRDLANRVLHADELRKTVATLDSKIESFADDETGRALRDVVERQKRAIQAQIPVLDEEFAAIQANRRVIEKLVADIRGDANRFTFNRLLSSTWYYIKNIWNTELTSVDERPVTIGKILMAMTIFFGGWWFSRVVSRRLRGFLSSRLKIDESAAAAFQSLALYTMVLMFLLGALNFVSIPLTVFTFLGGALAIGVGFGSQNILSNFISGLIMLAERPVKVGDLIQMDEFVGNIESIGARSTVVRTGTNLKLIVPNSKFLENNVVNLTHGSNHTIRAFVSIGVAYGSSPRDVTRLLKQAASDHGLVLRSPEPFVLFKDFGANSLLFELNFWMIVNRPLDRLRMESDLRYRIDSLFNEAGIVIALPQRDVHLDTMGPIDIRLVGSEKSIQSLRSDAA